MTVDIAEAALRAAASPDPNVRHNQFTTFMQQLEELLAHPEQDRGTFAARTAPLIAAAKDARDRWVQGFLDGVTCG